MISNLVFTGVHEHVRQPDNERAAQGLEGARREGDEEEEPRAARDAERGGAEEGHRRAEGAPPPQARVRHILPAQRGSGW